MNMNMMNMNMNNSTQDTGAGGHSMGGLMSAMNSNSNSNDFDYDAYRRNSQLLLGHLVKDKSSLEYKVILSYLNDSFVHGSGGSSVSGGANNTNVNVNTMDMSDGLNNTNLASV
eukprot:CAMPEP_0178961200 /NCGR_PEP_ID=MMETSP0789-20121207/13538_1 /TAXON_ID=3005 /ORGANISM="Rhizosolenia setigera, Strain CCMP 1694" /LENGTH=113 /DNA_ID=CAMNT_0020644935 /DNA_START=110 /DNA_END=451 /DNA_ORIENTATION=+